MSADTRRSWNRANTTSTAPQAGRKQRVSAWVFQQATPRQGSPGQAGPRARRGRGRGHRGLLPLPPRGRLSPRLAWVRGQPLSPSCPLLRPRGVSRRGYHSHIVSSAWVGLGSQSSAPGDAVWHVKPTQCEQRWIQPAAGERASNGSINPTPPAEPPGDPGSHVGPAGELRRGALGRLGRAALMVRPERLRGAANAPRFLTLPLAGTRRGGSFPGSPTGRRSSRPA